MSLPADTRALVRQRAHYACEYCGVTETDAGGELTADHIRPQSQGGTDDLDNLAYCCPRCNEYKSDYWPVNDGWPALWNPRGGAPDAAFVELADGRLHPLTPSAAFTLSRLRLNRSPLIAHRLQRRLSQEETRLLARLDAALTLIERLQVQQEELLREQRELLVEQRRLLTLLLRD